MVVSFLLFLAVLMLLLALYVRKTTEWKNPPPGPYIHPIIGSLPTMVTLDPAPFKAFTQLSHMFGPVVRIIVGGKNMMILSRYTEIKDAMNNEELDDRSSGGTANLIRFGNEKSNSISLFVKNDATQLDPKLQWRELRRFMLKSLRDLGFGKSASEESILDEASILIRHINKKIKENNGNVQLGKTINSAGLNVIWNLIGSKKFDYDDENMKKLFDYTDAFMSLGKDLIGTPLGALPILRFIPPFRSKFYYILNGIENFKDFIKEAIEDRKTKMEVGNPTCLIDDFLEKIGEDTTGIFTEAQLVHSCIDFFLAGSETTNKTQEWLIAMLIHNPEIQKKVQAELDIVASGRHLVTMADKDNLPYTEATFNETWRYCNVAPFGPPREAPVDVKMGEYTIPAGTQVFYNTHTMNTDPDIWGDPTVFRPERFIEEGKFKPHDRLFPFGIGRRRCLGETLARVENFLFFANLMLNFSFSPVGDALPSLEPDPGFTNGPKPYSCIITPRV